MPSSSATRYVQAAFDELGEPLRAVTFVVVDLETTGGAAGTDAITEIGAVRVRGGEHLGEFQTLVNPGSPIPPFVTVLTGISDAMVLPAPTIDSVLPAFLEFAHGAVLVAHNAPFDVGFLRAACAHTGRPWPGFRVVDTAALARRVLTRDEVPNRRLATLARFFRARTAPTHRALDDARATVDVLHGLFERLGPMGVASLDELTAFSHQVSAAQRRKRHLAASLPNAPGVYVFRDERGEPLYIGTSHDIRTRVRSYFVSGETRTRIREMLGVADRVEAIVCAHTLEAQVRELRMIAEHKPRYNRRSRFPERALWIRLTVEPYPRLSVVRTVREGTCHLGPFSSRPRGTAVAAVHRPTAGRAARFGLCAGGHGAVWCALCGRPEQAGVRPAGHRAARRAGRRRTPTARPTTATDRAAGVRRPVRGRRDGPGPGRRAVAGLYPATAADRSDVGAPPGRRPPGRFGRLGTGCGLTRTPGRCGGGAVRRGTQAVRGRAGGDRGNGSARAGTVAGGHRRGDRVRAALVGGARQSTGPTGRGVDLPGTRGGHTSPLAGVGRGRTVGGRPVR